MIGLLTIPLLALSNTHAGSTQPVIDEIEEVETIQATTTEMHTHPVEPIEEEVEEPTKIVTNQSWIDPEGKEVVEERFGKNHPLVQVARCESGYRQYNDDGSLLENPSPKSSASGIFQILRITHGPTAESMGMDITTPEGNMDYAEYLYNKNGLSDWSESRSCWGPRIYT